MNTRYIATKAILTQGNVLIPFWDKKIKYSKSEDFGVSLTLEGDYHNYELIDCLYDFKLKKLLIGIDVDVYPKAHEFEKGQKVYYELNGLGIPHQTLGVAKIKEIVYEEYELRILKGSKLTQWDIAAIKPPIVIEPNALYAIKNWKSFYILDNGIKIEYAHQLYHSQKQ